MIKRGPFKNFVGDAVREQTVLTPRWLLDEIIKAVGLPITLDPCTTLENPVGAKMWFTNTRKDREGHIVDSGLDRAWAPHCIETGSNEGTTRLGLAYVNPPYADLEGWLIKAVIEAKRGTPIVMLGPWRPQRTWFGATFRAAPRAELCSIMPIAFVGSKSGFPAPLFLAGWNVPTLRNIQRPLARGKFDNLVTGVWTP